MEGPRGRSGSLAATCSPCKPRHSHPPLGMPGPCLEPCRPRTAVVEGPALVSSLPPPLPRVGTWDLGLLIAPAGQLEAKGMAPAQCPPGTGVWGFVCARAVISGTEGKTVRPAGGRPSPRDGEQRGPGPCERETPRELRGRQDCRGCFPSPPSTPETNAVKLWGSGLPAPGTGDQEGGRPRVLPSVPLQPRGHGLTSTFPPGAGCWLPNSTPSCR